MSQNRWEAAMKRKSFPLIIVILLISYLLMISCTETPVEDEKTPPVMPSAQTMAIDLTLFNNSGTQSIAKANIPESKLNFGTAALTLSVVNITLALHLAVPVFLWGSALSQDPVLATDGKFHWIYSAETGWVTYEADLAGWVDVENPRVHWEMGVTQSVLHLDDFIWYDGSCNVQATEGDWRFFDYRQPDQVVQVVRIDWEVQDETHRILEFENVFQGDANQGDKLGYQVDGDTARVQYFDISENVTAKIIWNLNTHAGYIQLPNYHSGTPAHWNENLDDVN
jgi:hypothetical protein